MTTTTIRRAERKDCARILELVKDLALYEKAPEQVTVTLEHFEESGFGEAPVWWAFVAEDEDGVCGFALYYIRYSTWKGQRLYLEDIFVDPAKRGKGIGKQLMERLVEESRLRNFRGMVWQVLDWNEPAIRFYERLGASFDGEWLNCELVR
ncbi:GNAT family N-acetyltransferase [Bacteroidales bacterium OttesenSCG-928-B11]|nr:GNAT family N-acetyltransferase [Bacteroidales bacterium OttesenSCG-928-B11]MDL2326694.1 GNAT family N-acetyltransferase [Bacteroidales bacterium OttesenSCG-928-A14]